MLEALNPGMKLSRCLQYFNLSIFEVMRSKSFLTKQEKKRLIYKMNPITSNLIEKNVF